MTHSSPRPTHRVTISDLANELMLSQSSVSAALNDAPGVSPATRARVKELAAAWGWHPHAGARALRMRRSMTVGLVLARNPVHLANEPFYSFVLAGLEEVLQVHDYSLLLRMVGEGTADQAIYRRWAEEHAVDGVVLFDVESDDARVALTRQVGLFAVVVGEPDDATTQLSVMSDAAEEARLIVEHLAGLGHTSVAHVCGPLRLRHEQSRVAAVRKQCGQRGMRLRVVESDYTIAGAETVTGRLMRGSDAPTAIIGSSDLISLGILRGAAQAGAAVPGQVAVISWDDSLAGQLVDPPLTALFRDPMAIGRLAAEVLVSACEGRNGDFQRFSPRPQLLVRGTTIPLVTVG